MRWVINLEQMIDIFKCAVYVFDAIKPTCIILIVMIHVKTALKFMWP